MESVLNVLIRMVIKGEDLSKLIATVQLPEHGAIRRCGDGHKVTSTSAENAFQISFPDVNRHNKDEKCGVTKHRLRLSRLRPGDSGELEEMTNDVCCQLHFLLDRQHRDLSSLRFLLVILQLYHFGLNLY